VGEVGLSWLDCTICNVVIFLETVDSACKARLTKVCRCALIILDLIFSYSNLLLEIIDPGVEVYTTLSCAAHIEGQSSIIGTHPTDCGIFIPRDALVRPAPVAWP
jgi:hypothetical protein